jgi:hypothetical protein
MSDEVRRTACFGRGERPTVCGERYSRVRSLRVVWEVLLGVFSRLFTRPSLLANRYLQAISAHCGMTRSVIRFAAIEGIIWLQADSGELVRATMEQPVDAELPLVFATRVSGLLLLHPPWRLLASDTGGGGDRPIGLTWSRLRGDRAVVARQRLVLTRRD